jgi:SnoaL-like domain
MSNSREAFDAVAIVVDWLDACGQRRLSDLLELYDDDATVDCCEGGRFEGRHALSAYWHLRLSNQDPGAFEIEAILPETRGVYLEYRCGRRTFRIRFRFNDAGKIVHTTCDPLVSKDDALAA